MEGLPVVWDYHVVLLLRPVPSECDADDGQNTRATSLIYDFDTTLDLPYDAESECLSSSFTEYPLSPARPHTMTSPGSRRPVVKRLFILLQLSVVDLPEANSYLYPLLSSHRLFALLNATSTDYLKQTFPYLSDPSSLDAQYHR